MPRDRDSDKLRLDANEIAFRTVQAALGKTEKPQAPGRGAPNPKAVKRGRRGGKKGGAARAAKLGPRARKRIAKNGAAARWRKD